jgi:hypothetical protein
VEKRVARHIFIRRRVRLKILELRLGVGLCCVVLRWWWSCLYSGFESCSSLLPLLLLLLLLLLLPLLLPRARIICLLGEEQQLGSIRFNLASDSHFPPA